VTSPPSLTRNFTFSVASPFLGKSHAYRITLAHERGSCRVRGDCSTATSLQTVNDLSGQVGRDLNDRFDLRNALVHAPV